MTWVFRIALALALAAVAFEAGAQTKVRLSVGGKPGLFYLPLTVTERLGYFKDEGLDVEISDLSGGSRALQALIGGSADVVTGAFDHTIQMQAKGQPVVAVVDLGRFPGFVLGIAIAKAASWRGFQDLKGMKIGITAPGSSTHFMALHLMTSHGLKREEASFISVGASASAVAAMQRGEIDALVHVDPMISLLESQNLIKVVADTRTAKGTQDVYGGPYPAAVLYASASYIDKNPKVMQSLTNAFVRALKWIQTKSAEEIAAVMPEEYALGNKPLYVASIKNSIAMFSPDGRFSRVGAETAYKVLREFDTSVHQAKIDVAKTYTEQFLDKATR